MFVSCRIVLKGLGGIKLGCVICLWWDFLIRYFLDTTYKNTRFILETNFWIFLERCVRLLFLTLIWLYTNACFECPYAIEWRRTQETNMMYITIHPVSHENVLHVSSSLYNAMTCVWSTERPLFAAVMSVFMWIVLRLRVRLDSHSRISSVCQNRLVDLRPWAPPPSDLKRLGLVTNEYKPVSHIPAN